MPTNSNNSIIKGLMPNKQSEKDILHPQPNNFNATNPQTMNFATVAKITQYPSVHQPNNYASFNLPNNYYSISQHYNYTTSIPFETNYSVSKPINASIPQKTNNYSFPHYTNCDSIYQNSQSIIKDLLSAQPKENNALIQHTDYQSLTRN